MSSVLGIQKVGKEADSPWFRWLPVVAGLLAMYVPTYLDVAEAFWQREDSAHGPLILAMVAWLLWRQRAVFNDPPSDTRPVLGTLLFVFGIVLYVIGRSQEFFQPDYFSQLPVILGAVLALQGRKAFWAILFPICFLLFAMPVPASILDAVLLPLKQYVSAVVENLLYWAGYPIARSGVVLNIGQYQLLIANACSGLNSMIALSSVGLLFVYLIRNPSIVYNVVLLGSALPIAFLANIFRVATLVLVTYHFGDGAGHAFHDYAGYAEIFFAFGAFFALDRVLSRLQRKRNRSA